MAWKRNEDETPSAIEALEREHYSREADRIAAAIVADVTGPQSVNAGPGVSTTGVYDVAMVEWAPTGRWADASSVQPGDYSSFAYSVSYNESVPTLVTSLKASGKSGLLGAPLPEGSTVLKQMPGDSAAGRDPSERYSVSASAADIAAFFNEAMPAAGWLKGGDSTETALFFEKGDLVLGVLMNKDGGTFTLMGS